MNFGRQSLRILFLSLLALVTACGTIEHPALQFQRDADQARLEHLEYWTGLIEAYEAETGYYPFFNEVDGEESWVQVRIASARQAQYFTPGSPKYSVEFDNNSTGRFTEFSVGEFVAELERVLGGPIDEKYDIQYVPTSSPTWYFYFATSKGYLMWVTCITCDVTMISTLLLDGYTPTVNIGSPEMAEWIPKALVRDELLSHPTFLEWKSRGFIKEGFVRERERLHFRDSKENPR